MKIEDFLVLFLEFMLWYKIGKKLMPTGLDLNAKKIPFSRIEDGGIKTLRELSPNSMNNIAAVRVRKTLVDSKTLVGKQMKLLGVKTV